LPDRRATTGQARAAEAFAYLLLSERRIPLQVKTQKTDKIL
jgi:hypothetical protein